MSHTATATVTAQLSPLGVQLANLALSLETEAQRHKSSAKYHRRRQAECYAARDQLRERASKAGIDLTITGVAEEHTHGPRSRPHHPGT